MGGKFDPEHFAIERNVPSIFTFPCATDGHDGNRRRENLSNAANCPGGADRGSPPRARRRGDRIAGRLLRYMSHLFGTERTYRAKLATSAFAAARRDHARRPAQGDAHHRRPAHRRRERRRPAAHALQGCARRCHRRLRGALRAPPARAHTTQRVESRAPRGHRSQLPLPRSSKPSMAAARASLKGMRSRASSLSSPSPCAGRRV